MEADERAATTRFKILSSVGQLPDGKYTFVLHREDEDPGEALGRFMLSQDGAVPGPFATEQLAMAAGSAALTDVIHRLAKNGIGAKRDRPDGET